MKIFLMVLILYMFYFIQKILKVKMKYFLPMAMSFVIFSLSFYSIKNLEFTGVLNNETNESYIKNTESGLQILDEDIPLGSMVMQSQNSIKIRETVSLPNEIYTTISYELSGYEKNFRYPTKDMLVTDVIELEIDLSKKFVGDYEISLPTVNDTEVFKVMGFEIIKGSNKFQLENKLNTPTKLIRIKNNSPVLEENTKIKLSLGIDEKNITYNEKTGNHVNFYYDGDFRIKFQNGNAMHEMLMVIINEEAEENVKFKNKIVTPYNKLGIDGFVGKLDIYDERFNDFTRLENFVFDKIANNNGSLKPSTKALEYEVDENNIIYSVLKSCNSYRFTVETEHKNLVNKSDLPYLHFVITKGGAFIKIDSMNVQTTNYVNNYIIDSTALLNVQIFENGKEKEGALFQLYKREFDGTSTEMTGEKYISDADGYLQRMNFEETEETLTTSVGHLIEEKNLILLPKLEGNKNSYYYLQEIGSGKAATIEISDVSKNGFYGKIRMNLDVSEYEINEEKIFYNKVGDEENFLKLFNIKINKAD